jgi:hypothetical protein
MVRRVALKLSGEAFADPMGYGIALRLFGGWQRRSPVCTPRATR